MLEIIFKVIDWFTRGRITRPMLWGVLAFTVIGVLAVVIFEIQTANFALEKYARATAILKDLDGLSSSEDARIAPLADSLVDRVATILSETQANPSLSATGHRLALVMIMGLPWLILSTIGVVEAVRRVEDWQYGLFGFLALAALFGGVAYMVPTDVHWFYRYLLLPLATYSVVVTSLIVIGNDDD